MRGRRTVADVDDSVARAARSIGLQVGLSTAVIVVLAIVAAAFVFDRQQLGEITSRIQTAALTADDVVDAPPGVWLVAVRDGTPEAGRSTPATLVTAALRAAQGPDGETTLRSGRGYPAWVAHRGPATYVAIYDLTLHQDEELRLIWSTAIAGGAGILLAALTGWVAGRRAVRPMAEALELQRQFVADASHELRTPLAVVSTRAQLLRRRLGTAATAEQRAEADQLVQDTRAMGDVVADLLLSAQLEASEAPADVVGLRALVAEVVASLQPYAAGFGVRLVAAPVVGEAPDAEPGGAGPAGADGDGADREVVVRGVATGLRRAVVALVDNAISHSPPDSEVAVVVSRHGPSARVDVVDHGPGVDPRDVDRLTRRFARSGGDGSRRRVGLGLALVTQVVRSHGGRLEVDRTAGGGATFSIVLPAAD
ncbi:histidine kinase [Intrasporangium chromatireducens Q5-1]|uniref:histidine kinase n=1 Tax=Intrasporangium chromatireducens Q5-1 TaxID=584657 RepID=W9GQ74_9MICO|nr:HAMP domain-containing sensor histidine kinase [Intrasporangium chromatireducens]EWT07207.1 histidine kinase [Intrasporangium chromatireducens Q5-1]